MYKTQSPDTSEAAERAQFEMLRRAGSRRRIARAHPHWNEEEIGLHWTALMCGEETAQRVRRELERRAGKEEAS
jgi:hypothetical protein